MSKATKIGRNVKPELGFQVKSDRFWTAEGVVIIMGAMLVSEGTWDRKDYLPHFSKS